MDLTDSVDILCMYLKTASFLLNTDLRQIPVLIIGAGISGLSAA